MAKNSKKKFFLIRKLIIAKKKRNSSAFYAKRFAAKEAATKALGTGIRKGISLKNIEISNNANGKPFISLKGSVASYLTKKIKKKKYNIHLSLSDDAPWAQATVIISYNNEKKNSR